MTGQPGRLIFEHSPGSGAWNMAVDEYLLEQTIVSGRAALRWYRWREPTLSLGYFQRNRTSELPENLARLPQVVRLTGGGAIVHDREQTYCLVLPPDVARRFLAPELYDVVHQALIDALAPAGLALRLRGGPEGVVAAALTREPTSEAARGPTGESVRGPTEEPFLCFARHDSHDVVTDGEKVIGSAQRRRRGAILQHGSILLQKSPLSGGSDGLLDRCSGLDVEAACLATTAVLGQKLGIDWTPEPLSASERDLLDQRVA